jgi:acetyl-CoA carboxylase biotin carboxyl carrier protein
MKPTEIKDLIDFLAKSNLDEVNIETENFKISVKRNAQQVITVAQTAPAPVARVEAQAVTPTPIAAPPPATSASAEVPSSGKKLLEIKSPMIGTFYRASSPENPPFVNVGDEIKPGKTVCIIEAMKLFNEIESDIAGRIVKVMVENATPVEYDQVLFLVEPL